MSQKRTESLLGNILPFKRREMEAFLANWKAFLCEPYKSMDIEEWCDIEFDFTHHRKSVVHRDIARAIAGKWTELNETQFARFMALHSNLSYNKNLDKRTDAIRRGISRQMKYFKTNKRQILNHGSIIVDSQQGQMPENGRTGSGDNVNPNRQQSDDADMFGSGDTGKRIQGSEHRKSDGLIGGELCPSGE